jgi:hypothetical protein
LGYQKENNYYLFMVPYHPAHARNNLCPRFGSFLEKLQRYVYMIIVGSATPTSAVAVRPLQNV